VSRRAARSSGFSLIEVIVVIAVISILASMAVPYAVQVIDQSRTDATRKEMEAIQKAILGDPALGTAGFVGDMGRLPQAPAYLGQLNTQLPGQPNRSTGSLGVQMGWWGPYINTGFDAQGYLNDAWGTPYLYPSPGAGQLTSYGPDRNPGGGDDIVYPPSPVDVRGSLLVNLHVWDSTETEYATNPSATVTFYYSNNGIEVPVTLGAPPYTFSGALIRSGLHAVWASCTPSAGASLVTGGAVVFVPGNNQQAKLDLYLR